MRRSLVSDLAVFAGGALVVVGLVHGLVPRWTGVDPFVAWMVLTIPLLWLPLLAAGGGLLVLDGDRWSTDRLRLHALDARGWRWTSAALVVMVAASAALGMVATALGLEVDPFRREPRAWTEAWVFAVWFV